MLTMIDRIESAIDRACLAIAHVALFAMAGLTALDTVYRYVIGRSLMIDEVSSEFFMPAIIFLVAAHLYSNGGFIRITSFSAMMQTSVQRLILWLSDLATFLLLAAVTYELGRRAIESYRFNEYSDSPLGYMLYPSIALVAAGAGWLALRTLKSVLTGRHPSDDEAVDI